MTRFRGPPSLVGTSARDGSDADLLTGGRPTSTTAQGFFELAPGDADSLGAKKFTFLAGNQRNARALAVRAPALALIIGELLRTPTATQPRCLRWLTAPIIAKAGRRCRAVSWIKYLSSR